MSGIENYSYNKKVIGRYASCNFKANYGSDETFFNDINQLKPSTIITYKNNKLLLRKYWDLDLHSGYLQLEGRRIIKILY